MEGQTMHRRPSGRISTIAIDCQCRHRIVPYPDPIDQPPMPPSLSYPTKRINEHKLFIYVYENEPAIVVFSFAAHCLKGGRGVVNKFKVKLVGYPR